MKGKLVRSCCLSCCEVMGAMKLKQLGLLCLLALLLPALPCARARAAGAGCGVHAEFSVTKGDSTGMARRRRGVLNSAY